MITLTAREAKNRFDELLNIAQREPVAISEKGRTVVVVLSQEEYARLRAIDDAYWAMRADLALENAECLSVEESEAVVKELLKGT